MSVYKEQHLYWAGGALLYFAVGALLCILILSVGGSVSGYHIGVILYTLLGLLLLLIWLYYYTDGSPGAHLFSSTLLAVVPEHDSPYAVLYGLYIKTALVSFLVVLLFWLWFLIYLLAVKEEKLERVLEVYAVVFLPFTFFIALFYLASWWLPATAATPCSSPSLLLLKEQEDSGEATPSSLRW